MYSIEESAITGKRNCNDALFSGYDFCGNSGYSEYECLNGKNDPGTKPEENEESIRGVLS